jgi:hypothetical protein
MSSYYARLNSNTNHFTVTVVEVNTAPMLPEQLNRTISRASTLVVTNTAFDSDLPPNNLSYALPDSPEGAQIDAKGVITWAATNFPAPGETSFTTVVSDDGVPLYSATNYFTVTVVEESSQPLITSVTVQDAAAAINWTSIIGRTYRLEFKDNLPDQTWTQVAPDVMASSSITTATNLVGETMQRFYRVVLLP